MHLLYFVLLVLATICFVLAAVGVPAYYFSWTALGLALLTLVFTIQQGRQL